jgi:DNA-binding MarR family transcriptional regulator
MNRLEVDKINFIGGCMNRSKMIRDIREFNRYYTIWLDVMNKGYLGTDRTWTESRILYELYAAKGITAQALCNQLRIDKSFMSRTLKGFEKDGLLERYADNKDKREKSLVLTDKGSKIAEDYNNRASIQIKDKIRDLDDASCQKLCEAMAYIQEVLK